MLRVVDKNGMDINLQEAYIEFSDVMDSLTVADLINRIEDKTDSGYIRLYFSSNGGTASSLMMLYDYFKNTDKMFQINVTGVAASAGLFILLMIKDFKNVSIYWDITSAGMAHMVDIDYSHRDLSNKRSFSSFMKEYTKVLSREIDKYAEGILTEDEVKDYHSGLDIYIDRDRLNKHFAKEHDLYIADMTDFLMSEGTVINLPEAAFVEECEEGQEDCEEKKIRGFEVVSDNHRKHKDAEIILPTRNTKNSAGYDFYSPVAIAVQPGESKMVATDVKAYMLPDEKLSIHLRSSVGIKKKLRLLNGTGIIDSDFYCEPDGDGNIRIAFANTGNDVVHIEAGERIAQGIFEKFLKADGDEATEERTGGIGSTGK